MMRLIIRERHWLFVIVVGWGWMFLAALPASVWIEARSVELNNADFPLQVTMRVDRTIKRQFMGDYTVTVRRQPGGAFVCAGGSQHPINYRTDRELPVPLYLWWWMGTRAELSACDDFGPGGYFVETCWTVINPFWGIVPDKTGCIDSTGFVIEGVTP